MNWVFLKFKFFRKIFFNDIVFLRTVFIGNICTYIFLGKVSTSTILPQSMSAKNVFFKNILICILYHDYSVGGSNKCVSVIQQQQLLRWHSRVDVVVGRRVYKLRDAVVFVGRGFRWFKRHSGQRGNGEWKT